MSESKPRDTKEAQPETDHPPLDDVIKAVLFLLQLSGPLSAPQIYRSLNCDAEVLYATLEVLSAAFLITQQVIKTPHGTYTAFVYRDGIVLPEAVDPSGMREEIAELQADIAATSVRLRQLTSHTDGPITSDSKQALAKLVSDMMEEDDFIRDDPLYRDLAERLQTRLPKAE